MRMHTGDMHLSLNSFLLTKEMWVGILTNSVIYSQNGKILAQDGLDV